MPPVSLGIVGCGAITQVQHLPNLALLQEEFDVKWVCDCSPALAECVARTFHVPSWVTDYRDLLASDVGAVMLCHTDPKTEAAVAAFDAGKHVFIEKPLCYSLTEADAIISAAQRSGKVGQVGYMKIHDPAFELARDEVRRMDRIRFVQVNHLHPDNALHTSQFRIRRFDDVPEGVAREGQRSRKESLRSALGDVPAPLERAFFVLSGSMIHDLYGLRVMLGLPSRVVSTEVWNHGRAISTVLEYPEGARCVATWVDLPNLWDFKETMEVYGDDRRVILSYPTGFARGILSTVTIHGIGPDGTAFRKEPAVPWESAFTRELRHFHDCIARGTPAQASVASARDDIALILDIIKTHILRGGP